MRLSVQPLSRTRITEMRLAPINASISTACRSLSLVNRGKCAMHPDDAVGEAANSCMFTAGGAERGATSNAAWKASFSTMSSISSSSGGRSSVLGRTAVVACSAAARGSRPGDVARSRLIKSRAASDASDAEVLVCSRSQTK
eukprot:GHVU01111703.1.p1 GENE.GHVU01111703.1~~GHVU01111703.1.p1  ORF type:complete len:142 (+),score=2.12 GHVU01111703.1:1-426(+)